MHEIQSVIADLQSKVTRHEEVTGYPPVSMQLTRDVIIELKREAAKYVLFDANQEINNIFGIPFTAGDRLVFFDKNGNSHYFSMA